MRARAHGEHGAAHVLLGHAASPGHQLNDIVDEVDDRHHSPRDNKRETHAHARQQAAHGIVELARLDASPDRVASGLSGRLVDKILERAQRAVVVAGRQRRGGRFIVLSESGCVAGFRHAEERGDDMLEHGYKR